MLSVRQLWEDSQVDCVFRDVTSIVVPVDGGNVLLPFKVAKDKLYRWDVLTPGADRTRTATLGTLHSENGRTFHEREKQTPFLEKLLRRTRP